MKLKLTNNELDAMCKLVQLVRMAMQKKRDDGLLDMEDKLHLALTERLWITLYKKYLNMKPKHSISLNPELAICFFLQFNDQKIPDAYLRNLVRQLCDKIDQHFAK